VGFMSPESRHQPPYARADSCLAPSTSPASAHLVTNGMSTRCLLRHFRRLERYNSTCPFCAVVPTHPHTGVLSSKRICATTTLH
jgi:hypothetical protein